MPQRIQIGLSGQEKLLLFAVLFLPCLFVWRGINNDLPFLLNSGRYVLEHGIPYTEPFTLHGGMDFIMQQWLSAVIFYAIFKAFGDVGLYILVMVVYAALIFVVYKVAIILSVDNFLVSYGIAMVIAAANMPFMVQRPYIFLFVFIALEIALLEKYILTGRIRFLMPLPFLSMIQINLQAAMWPVLFAVLLPYLLDALPVRLGFIKCQGYPMKPLLATVAAMLLVGLANPYGASAVTYLFHSLGYREINLLVNEMKVPNINDDLGKIIFGSIGGIVLTYCLFRKGNTRLRYVLLTMGTAWMALSSVRSFSIFILCSIISLAYLFRDVGMNRRISPSSKKILPFRITLFLLILAIAVSGFLYQLTKPWRFDQPTDLTEALEFIREAAREENVQLYTGYDEGGHAEYYGLKPYIDPRAEVFVKKNNHKEDIMEEYFMLQTGRIYYADVLEKYQFTHLLISESDILGTYLPKDDNYQEAYSNKSYRVFVRK